mmetsp:Transcript_11729/g.14580  ORF Transcript_11729/g.14580 Transcript_11729/m.14580 type:complete len:148 (-) Transcript_11729:179-622(-)
MISSNSGEHLFISSEHEVSFSVVEMGNVAVSLTFLQIDLGDAAGDISNAESSQEISLAPEHCLLMLVNSQKSSLVKTFVNLSKDFRRSNCFFSQTALPSSWEAFPVPGASVSRLCDDCVPLPDPQQLHRFKQFRLCSDLAKKRQYQK